jgi:anthranilate synthase component I
MQTFPSKEQFLSYAKEGYNVIPVWTEVLADLETPVSCYLKVKEHCPDKGPFFLLESVEGGEKLGRYSAIGLNPAGMLTLQNGITHFAPLWPEANFQPSQGNTFDSLAEVLNKFQSPSHILPHMVAGLVGAISYDTVRFVEPIDVKIDQTFPESIFVLTGDLIVFDNLTRTLRLISNAYLGSDPEKSYRESCKRIKELKSILQSQINESKHQIISNQLSPSRESLACWSSSLAQDKFERIVNYAKELIKAGDIFQIVLSQQLSLNLTAELDSLYLYRLLRSVNPSPYLFFLDFLNFQIIGSSPEVMVKCDALTAEGEQTALLRPIAGTYRRGKTEAEDLELAKKLQEDPKELAEHLMLIDLARNDLGRVGIPGTVSLTEQMVVEKYSHVLHLVSEVVCKVKPEMSSVDLLKAVFPAGTLSGAPKVKAMQIIAELEPVARGFYGGCVGYFGFDGSMNTAMTIRTLLLKDNQIRLQVGAGIVYDSDPAKEYQETLNKGAALLKVIEKAMS